MSAFSETVQTFLTFTSTSSPQVALAFLKGNNNDVGRAVDAFFENPDPKRYEVGAPSWSLMLSGSTKSESVGQSQVHYDESPWSGDRYGQNVQGETLTPFLVDIPADANDGFGHSGAPTRPSSRASDHQPTQNEGLDASAKASFGDGSKGAKTTFGQQETGIVDIAGREYVPDVETQDRRRRDGEPAFMKPLPSQDFLPSLITILNSIPQYRNALLEESLILPDYGYNPHWLEGDPIGTSRISLAEEQAHPPVENLVLHEAHRLISFLDYSNRAYGSVGALSNLCSALPARGWTEEPMFARFLAYLDSDLQDSDLAKADTSLFTSRRTAPGSRPWETADAVYIEVPASTIVNRVEASLYDALDSVMWGNEEHDFADASVFENIAPIIVMRVAATDKDSLSSKVKIPSLWYADRYLLSNASLVRELRKETGDQKTKLDTIQDKLSRAEASKAASSGKLRSSMVMLSVASDYIASREASNHSGMVEGAAHSPVNDRDSSTAARLDKISSHLSSCIVAMNGEREAAQANLAKVSRFLTEASSDGVLRPSRGYRLCGVAKCKANREMVTYTANPVNTVDDLNGGESPEKWWRMSYATWCEPAKIENAVVSEEEVLDAAGDGSVSTLLIYASHDMLNYHEQKPIPVPLKEFAMKYNDAFRLELAGGGVEVIEGQEPEEGQMDASFEDTGEQTASPATSKSDMHHENVEASSQGQDFNDEICTSE